jgi:CheY-like chemotaxis protein
MTRQILIVEDDPELHELYRCMLAGQPYYIEPASDAAEGLDLLGRAAPDVILLDLLLGDVSGGEFFRAVKRNPRYASIPVIIATVLPQSACQDLLAMAPRALFLRKPFSKRTLLAALEQVLSSAA